VADNKTKIIIEAVDKTKAAFQSAGQGLQSISNSASSLNNVLGRLGPVAAAVGATSLLALVKNGINAADAMNDLAARTGLSVEKLGAWQLAAKLSDTSLEALGKGLRNLSVNMVKNADDFEKLGIAAKTPEEALIQLAGVLNTLDSDDPRRAALGVQLLGKSYQELAPLLAEGEEGLRKLYEQGKELNPITQQSAEDAAKFNDQLDILTVKAQNAGISIGLKLLPTLNDTFDMFSKAYTSGNDLDGMLAKLRLTALAAAPGFALLARSFISDAEAAPGNSASGKIRKANPESDEAARLKKRIDELLKQQNGSKAASAAKTNPATETASNYASAYGELSKIVDGTDRLTKAEMILRDIEQGRFNELLPWQREQLANLAQQAKAQQDVNTLNEINKRIVEDIEEKRAKERDEIEQINKRNVEDIEAKREAGREARAETLKDLEEQNKELDFQLSIADLSERAQRQAIANRQVEIELQRILNQAAADGVVLQAKEVEAIRAKLQTIADKTALIDYTRESKSMYNELISAVRGYGREFTTTLREAFKTGELDFKDMASRIIDTLIDIQIQTKITDPLIKAGTKAIDGIFNGSTGGGLLDTLSGLFGGASAKGNVFSGGSMMKFANGGAFTNGLVNTPTMFPMGLMGEAGPEAIMPLQRDGSGRLGVKAAGGGAPTVIVQQTIHIDSRSDQASIMAAMRTAKDQAVDAVITSLNRGGAVARAVKSV
jgi:lambda family phage tail tape measure protein